MDNYYAHTIRVSDYDRYDLDILEKIFKCGYILSRNGLNKIGEKGVKVSLETALFNGMDYVSLCDLSKRHDYYSAYEMYVKRGLSLLFSHGIRVLEPIIIEKNLRNLDYINNMHNLGIGVDRYSDLLDEVQVKNEISLAYLKGLSLSINSFLKSNSEEYLRYYLKNVKYLLMKYNYKIPIYNIDTGEKILKKW